MNENLREIKSGIGIGIIKFGMFRKDIKKILGVPSESEQYNYSDTEEDISETWHYDDLSLSIGFDQEDDWRLMTLSVSSKFYQFRGKHLIGLSKTKVTGILKELKIDDLEFEDLSTIESPDHKLISSDSIGINFWFDHGILDEIQWGPLFIDDETINWPD